MKKLKLSLQSIEGAEVLSREQLKRVIGGEDGSGDAAGKGLCLGCSTDQECARVNKGSCEYCETHRSNCCSGWHNHG